MSEPFRITTGGQKWQAQQMQGAPVNRKRPAPVKEPSNRTSEQILRAMRNYEPRVTLLLGEAGFDANVARVLAEALSADQSFTRALFAAHMAKVTKEVRLLRLVNLTTIALIVLGLLVEVLRSLHLIR